MRRLLDLFFVGIGLSSTIAFAEEPFTVSGEVAFPKDGDIYIELRTQTEQAKDEKPLPPRLLTIKLTPEQRKANRASFKLVSVPRGTYCIKAFQDTNKNGELDFVEVSRLPAPIEPNGFYRPSWPIEWDNIKFEVDRDITGIKIELRLGPP
ncbi:MAG: DUF2141 domain-containing protein [Proteobacteria bacterium]|nr:DUF2141 domain-containing protein [Pseudomonadota bacterium]